MNDGKNLENTIEKMVENFDGTKKQLLLHCCCAPCSTVVFERLSPYFDITALYYNPNITDTTEHEKRWQEVERLASAFGIKAEKCPHEKGLFRRETFGLEREPERGRRCDVCFFLRLSKTAALAAERGIPFFATTLTLGPQKNAAQINVIGDSAALAAAVSHGIAPEKLVYLSSDFKKKDGYKRSIELSTEHELYRQNYCGCLFSR